MKYLSLIFSLIISLSSCKSETKAETKTTGQQIEKSVLRDYEANDSVFLKLSPKMSQMEFEREILKENGRRLENGVFKILLNDQTLPFQVEKTESSIQLQFSRDFSRNDLNDNRDKILFNQLFDLLDSKYNYHETSDFANQIGFNHQTKTFLFDNPHSSTNDSINKHLIDYGLGQTDYAVFNNSIKTVVLGFSTRKSRNIGSIPPRYIEDKDGNYKINPIKKEEIKWYVFSTTIDYFLNPDFDSLTTKVNQDYSRYQSSLRLLKEKNERTKNDLKKNKMEL